MYLLGCEKLHMEFSTKEVFSQLSLGINSGDRIGIVGRNGDGKSTLLRLLAGVLQPDDGRVTHTRGLRVGLLEQRDSLVDEATVLQAVCGDRATFEWAGDARIRNILKGLLPDVSLDAHIGELSGGQRRRVDLARLLVDDWDVLMLDEPTNHLDIVGISWLATHLKTRWRTGGGALLVVTHDRWFLDEVCTFMWEVHDGIVEPFEGGYSAYIMQRVERARQAAAAEAKRQNLLRRELAWLSRGARARATKPKFHVAAAEALIADVPPLRNEIELKRMAMARLGKDVVELQQVSLSYATEDPAVSGQKVLGGIDWIIGAGDRFGIVGGNGCGKTTLLKVITGALAPTQGRVKIGKTVRFAVLSQHLDSLMSCKDDRIREVLSRYGRRVMLDGKELTPGQLFEKLGFDRAVQNDRVCDLSGGQQRRLALMLILLDEPNVLILDEPGNDLDTDMLTAVEDLLDGWPGTLLLVTHDRYLMERVTDHQFALLNGMLRHLPRGVDEYLQLVADESEAAAEEPAPKETQERAALRMSGGDIRKYKKQMESAERKMLTIQTKIEAAEAALTAVNPSDYVALTEAQAAIETLRTQYAALEEEWLVAAEMLEDA